jgi:hypothetical protein
MPTPSPRTVEDGFLSFSGGMNSGVIPMLVPEGQAAFAVNTTFRGAFAQNRGGFVRNPIDFEEDTVVENRFTNGRFQGAGIYTGDDGKTSILVSISGRLYQIFPSRISSRLEEVTINFNVTITQAFAAPTIGDEETIVVSSTANLAANYEILIEGDNYFIIQVIDGTTLVVRNIDMVAGTLVPVGTILNFWDTNPSVRLQTWIFQAERWAIINDGQSVPIFFDGATSRRAQQGELRAGRMGAYGWGRVWMAGTMTEFNGRSYFAGDLVNGPSGTPAFRLRDSVLKMTENTFLDGGGTFLTPGNTGPIQGMAFPAILDSSLGQGPLQVLTPQQIFSCNTPIDRTEWATTENPIQTISQVTSGTTSQWSISPVNGDIFYRALDGFRSLTLGRREFNTWGNVPLSREMNRVLQNDDPNLLQFSSTALFDNRLLMTCSPFLSQRGTYHRGLIALDFDSISAMRDKAPPVYDGLWTGLQVLQIVRGVYDTVERCHAFVLTGDGHIELWELLKREEMANDQNNTPVLWSIETSVMFKTQDKGGIFQQKRLSDGELYVDNVKGRVDFQVFYKPSQVACWTEWGRWSICAKDRSCAVDVVDGCVGMTELQPQAWPRMGFGTPSTDACDPVTKTPYAIGETFQFKIQVQGQCRLLGAKFSATVYPEQAFAPMICRTNDCYTAPEGAATETYTNEAQTYTAECPDGETGDPVSVTIPAGSVRSTISIASANAIALQAAQQQAEASLQCEEAP